MSLLLVEATPAAGWLAGVAVQQPSPAPNPDPGPEFGGSSPIGLVVILLLGIVVVFLIRSMTKHLRRVPESFDKGTEPGPEGDEGGAAPTS
jgi:hypothetical protein